MKAVIPLAGQGTRLYPQTHTKPKAMVRIAGKPILGHILSNLAETRIDEVVLIVGGSLKDQIREYVTANYADTFDVTFINQESAEGLGHAVFQSREAVAGDPIFIALGDMLFENRYETFLKSHDDLGDVDASIGVKHVEEPSHYGVVDVDDEDTVTELVEKPDDPPSNRAISGVYVVENSAALFDELAHLIENNLRGAGDEYQLTDALQGMVETGSTLGTFDVEEWYDCGRPATLLEANRVLLESMDTNDIDTTRQAVIVPPVDIGENVTIERSVVGPYVSLDNDAEITDSIVHNSIVGRRARLSSVNLNESIVGDAADITGEPQSLNVGDNSDLRL